MKTDLFLESGEEGGRWGNCISHKKNSCDQFTEIVKFILFLFNRAKLHPSQPISQSVSGERIFVCMTDMASLCFRHNVNSNSSAVINKVINWSRKV